MIEFRTNYYFHFNMFEISDDFFIFAIFYTVYRLFTVDSHFRCFRESMPERQSHTDNTPLIR